MRKLLAFLLVLGSAKNMLAQGGADNLFRSNQKFLVVVAVLVIILLGIIFFLFGMERRLKNLEQKK